MSAQVYLAHFGLPVTGNATNNIRAMAQDIIRVNRLDDEQADRVQLATALQGEASAYEQLSNALHNPNVNLSSDHVRAVWETVSGGLRIAWRRVHLRPRS